MKKTQNKTKKTGLGRGLGSLLSSPSSSSLSETKTSINSEKTLSEADKGNTTPTQYSRSTNIEKEVPKEKDFIDQNKSQVFEIDIEKIYPNPTQPRKKFDKEALNSLAASIKEQGIIQPIVVKPGRDGHFEIIAGERRWRASQIAGLHRVSVIIKKIDEQKTLEWALIENIQREDLNPIEEGKAYKHLIDKYALTQAELAKKMGKERATIANVLRLLNLCPEAREMLINTQLSMGQAKLLLTVSDFREQFKLARKVVTNKLTVKQTEKLVKKFKNTQEGSVESPSMHEELVNSQTKQLEQELQKVLGTKVQLDYSKGKSKVQIHFYSDDELNGFVDRVREKWN